MLQSAVLDVAMGVVFMFLLVSLLVSAATELLASMLKWRATNLWQGVARLMQSENARTQLYEHPLIKGLAARAVNEKGWNDGRNGPSYIPSRTFAMALIDLLREPREAAASVQREFEQALSLARTNPATLVDALNSTIARLLPQVPPKLKDDLVALQQRTLAINSDPNAAMAEVNTFLLGRLKHWTNYATGGLEGLAGALGPLLDEAAGDVDRFRDEIENWFNSGMDRVSGWYKRHTQAWQFAVAFALAISLNIDTLLLVTSLWQDPALRQAIASQASQVAANPPPSLRLPPTAAQDSTGQLHVELSQSTVDAGDTVTAYIDLRAADANRDVDVSTASGHLKILDTMNQPQTMMKTTVPSGQKATVTLRADSVTSESLEQFQVSRMGQSVQSSLVVRPSSTERFAAIKNQLGETNLPIGWRSCGPATAKSQRLFWCEPPSFNQTWILGVLAMFLGWLITSAAASLGAPFWFDTLNRVANVRAAVKPPETPKKDGATA